MATSGTSLAASYEQLSGAVALHIVINAVVGGRHEELHTRVFPHTAVVLRRNSAHGLLAHHVMQQYGVARMGHAERRRGTVGPV